MRTRGAGKVKHAVSLSRDRHDHARWLLGQLRGPRFHRGLEQLAHFIGRFPLTRALAEVDRGRRHAFEGEVSGLGDVPAGIPQLGGGALGDPSVSEML